MNKTKVHPGHPVCDWPSSTHSPLIFFLASREVEVTDSWDIYESSKRPKPAAAAMPAAGAGGRRRDRNDPLPAVPGSRQTPFSGQSIALPSFGNEGSTSVPARAAYERIPSLEKNDSRMRETDVDLQRNIGNQDLISKPPTSSYRTLHPYPVEHDAPVLPPIRPMDAFDERVEPDVMIASSSTKARQQPVGDNLTAAGKSHHRRTSSDESLNDVPTRAILALQAYAEKFDIFAGFAVEQKPTFLLG